MSSVSSRRRVTTYEGARRRRFKLSPSDFAFLWEECKRCYYSKVVEGVSRPRTPLPKIFTAIDASMKAAYLGARTSDVTASMPPGQLAFPETTVESETLMVTGRAAPFFIRGRFDCALQLDDGSYGVVDFKTAPVEPAHLSVYARQLHAYAFALEHPAPQNFGLEPVSTLGLLVFEPARFRPQGGEAELQGRVAWVELPRDDGAFADFVAGVLEVLEAPSPPPPDPFCEWCIYRGVRR